jgi:hypothetical protein
MHVYQYSINYQRNCCLYCAGHIKNRDSGNFMDKGLAAAVYRIGMGGGGGCHFRAIGRGGP